MENNQNDLELVFGESAETLWANFEKTGSIRDYLLYTRRIENAQELNRITLPS